MKRMLLLGASGFIGKNLNKFLIEKKEYIIDTPSSKELNLIDEREVTLYLQKNYFDIIIHLAVYGDGIDKNKDANKILEYNLRMFLNFEKNSCLFGKMYFTGSGAEYDKRYPIVNIKETQIGVNVPVDHYGLMKYTIDKLIEKSTNIYNLKLFGVYGKYEYWPIKFISNICCKAIKGLPITIRQNVYFDYLWIDDFCRIMVWFLENEPKYHSYNIVTGRKIDLLTIARKVIKISNKNLPIYVCKEGLTNEYTASNERLLNEIGAFEYTDIDISIKNLYQWYEKNENIIDIYLLLYQ